MEGKRAKLNENPSGHGYDLLIWHEYHEYMLKRRSGLTREKAHSKAFAGKPAPTIHSCSIRAESITHQKHLNS